LVPVRDRLREMLGADFNSVLVNRYRDGRDRMGWHSDDEPELGPQPVIASISLGAARRFTLKPRGEGAPLALDLPHGSLLVMRGDTQAHYRHALPATTRPVGERVNLTFRRILPAG
jgi:alkylated DNA repair dioxygenase AlkB